MSNEESVRYLGDGLYGAFDGFQIELRANDPYDPTDRVYIDPGVAVNVINFIKDNLGVPK